MTTALTTKPSADDILAILPDAGDAYDGYSQAIGADKIRIARKVFNKSGVDAKGHRFAVDMFYDTNTETSSTELRAILADIHATREYAEFNETDQRYDNKCSSADAKTGVWAADGAVRTCKGCPDAEWVNGPKGKRTVNCSEVFTVMGIDLENMNPFLLKFWRTSTRPLVDHITKHHANQLRVAGKTRNVPLYAYTVRLTLKLADNGKYATPIFERTGLVTAEQAAGCIETIQALREHARAAAAQQGEPDTSFDPDAFTT